METEAIARCARERQAPFRAIRVVSDLAGEDLPLDFNLYLDAEGHISRGRIALHALKKPFTTIPALARLNRNCRIASEALGEFLVDRGL